MTDNTADENVMRRFLLGMATPEEQDEIEHRLADRDFYHALASLEDEMALQSVRGELRSEWRDAFLSGPGRREQVEEMRAFQAAIRKGRVARAAQRRPPRLLFVCAAAAALVVLAAGITFVLRGGTSGPDTPAVTSAPSGVAAGAAVATLVLPPGSSRADSAANAFRLPAGATQVRLQMTISTRATESLQASLTPVGGTAVRPVGMPNAFRTGDEVELSWFVPVEWLPAGDYLLTVSAKAAKRDGEPIATRFFSIID